MTMKNPISHHHSCTRSGGVCTWGKIVDIICIQIDVKYAEGLTNCKETEEEMEAETEVSSTRIGKIHKCSRW